MKKHALILKTTEDKNGKCDGSCQIKGNSRVISDTIASLYKVDDTFRKIIRDAVDLIAEDKIKVWNVRKEGGEK